MLKIYGSKLCRSCVQCKADLDQAGVEYEFLDFADQLSNLREFLAIRDGNPMFDEIRQAGRVGIPCIENEDGEIFLDWKRFM